MTTLRRLSSCAGEARPPDAVLRRGGARANGEHRCVARQPNPSVACLSLAYLRAACGAGHYGWRHGVPGSRSWTIVSDMTESVLSRAGGVAAGEAGTP
jgi:hypothetical protein